MVYSQQTAIPLVAPSLRGMFEGIENGYAVGWALDRQVAALTVRIYDARISRGGRQIAAGRTEIARPAVEAALRATLSPWKHVQSIGFRIPLPREVLDGRQHMLCLYAYEGDDPTKALVYLGEQPVGFTAHYDAAFIDQYVPTTMIVGQRYAVVFCMRNTGTLAWDVKEIYIDTPGRFILDQHTSLDQSDRGVTRSPEPGVSGDGPWREVTRVDPGSMACFEFSIIAPTTPGVHTVQWRMAEERGDWFGEATPFVAVTVVPAS